MLAFYISKKPGHELYSVISMIDHFFLEEILGNLIPIAFLVRFKIERVLPKRFSWFENELASEHVFRDWILYLPFL